MTERGLERAPSTLIASVSSDDPSYKVFPFDAKALIHVTDG
ncbi:MAG: hypothetical protein OSA81_07310 [Longimicrobiales bacterium]|nr:hypothetical protein [Longimicrobiales bacterium]